MASNPNARIEQLTATVQQEYAKRRARALAMRNDGKTYQEIGEALGVSHQRAQAMVKAAQKDMTTR